MKIKLTPHGTVIFDNVQHSDLFPILNTISEIFYEDVDEDEDEDYFNTPEKIEGDLDLSELENMLDIVNIKKIEPKEEIPAGMSKQIEDEGKEPGYIELSFDKFLSKLFGKDLSDKLQGKSKVSKHTCCTPKESEFCCKKQEEVVEDLLDEVDTLCFKVDTQYFPVPQELEDSLVNYDINTVLKAVVNRTTVSNILVELSKIAADAAKDMSTK